MNPMTVLEIYSICVKMQRGVRRTMSEYAYSTAIETASAIAKGDVSSRELLEAALARVEQFDSSINAVVALDAERALDAADAADAAVASNQRLGPLHGVPITIKDSFQTEGLVTTSGAPQLSEFLPDHDADPVARYKSAGAIVYGKRIFQFGQEMYRPITKFMEQQITLMTLKEPQVGLLVVRSCFSRRLHPT